jgi:hypothetical protein
MPRFFKLFFGVTLLVSSTFLGASPVWAGKLFPPENATGANKTCPSGKLLVWEDGAIKCASAKVSETTCTWVYVENKATDVSCPSGSYVAGIGYEGAEWSLKNDTFAYPEMCRIKCCTLAVSE